MDNYSICYSLFLSIRLVQKGRIADFGDRKDNTFSNTSYTCHFYLDGKRKWETRMVTLIPGWCKNVFCSITNWRKIRLYEVRTRRKDPHYQRKSATDGNEIMNEMGVACSRPMHGGDNCIWNLEKLKAMDKNGTIILKQILNEKGATT
jgi:hypothetical protein